MKIIRHCLVALTPFAFGLLLGFATAPTDAEAKARADFAGISQMSDIRCWTAAQSIERAIFMTAFQYYNFRLFLNKNCDGHFAEAPPLDRLPAAAFGHIRQRFQQDR